MRAVVQRVSQAEVRVDGECLGSIQKGLLVYLGIKTDDSEKDVEYLATKVANLRIFEDTEGKMNLSALDRGYGALVISQFTLLGDVRRGHRPSFIDAAPPEMSETLYELFIGKLSDMGIHVESGRFRAMMEVDSVNWGPVTILLDSKKQF